MGVIIVQAGNIGKLLTARRFEAFFDLFVDFLKRLDAIR